MWSSFAVFLIYYKGKSLRVGVTEDHVMLFCRDINCTVDHMIQLPAKSYGWGCKLACMQHQDGKYIIIFLVTSFI